MFDFLIGLGAAAIGAITSAVSTVGAAVGSAATAIGTAATTAISSAGQFLSTIATKIPPILEPPADKLKKVLGFMEKISKNIGEQSNDEIRNMEAYSEDASISQLQNLNSILNNMRMELKEDIKEVEETFSVNLEDSFNKIESFIKENICSQGINIDILALRHNFDKLINDFKNSFSNNINGRIALSDYECLNILGIKNPEERSNRMKNYLDEIIEEYLNKYFDDLDFITNNTIEFIQRSVERIKKEQLIRVDIIKKEIEDNINLNESEIEEKRKEYERKEEIINNLLETIK